MTKHRTGSMVAASLVVGLMAVINLTVASPAQAVPGLQRVAATSVADAQSPKVVTAQCPRGTRALDGGATIVGAEEGKVWLNGMIAWNSSFTATASAAAGYRGEWRLTTYAICAPELPGMILRAGTAVGSPEQWWRSISVSCPEGLSLIGLGAVARDHHWNPATGVALQVLLPREDLTSFVAQAYLVDDTYQGNWHLAAHAVCAPTPPGLVRIAGQPESPGAPVAKATCPVGTKLHGMGGLLSTTPGTVALVGMYPATDLSDTLTFGAELGAGGKGIHPWSYAICAQ
jgi:hypothetical protein